MCITVANVTTMLYRNNLLDPKIVVSLAIRYLLAVRNHV